VKLFLRRRLQSLGHAGRGLRVMLATQPSAWIHAVASLAVIAAGLALGVDAGEWCWLAAAIAAVWTAEAFNTALEFLADEVSLEQRERIGRAKDLGAAAVLCSALGAVAIGLITFVPHLLRLVRA
jgi:diacylglycerol kinase (ATP)